MTFPYNQQAYTSGTGTSQIPAFRFETRDPNSSDFNSNSKLYEGWVNTSTKAIWYLEAITASSGTLSAQWRAVGPIVVNTSPPAAPLTSSADYAYPIGQTWVDTATDSYYVLVGNPTDTTGYWIRLSSGGQTVEEFAVDASTPPGTDPVVPDGDSVVTVTGGQVAADTTVNVIQTNSLAANTYTIQVQRSTDKATPTVGSNGVCHFDSAYFSVDSDAFVTLASGPASFTPTLAFGGGSTGVTYGVQEGYYYRLGPVVFVSIYLDVTSTGTDTGNATIEGLPITVRSSSSQILEAQSDQVQFTANYTYMFGRPITSGTSIQLWESASVSGSSSTNLTKSSFSATPSIRVQGYYFA